jgi:hypothetical protein
VWVWVTDSLETKCFGPYNDVTTAFPLSESKNLSREKLALPRARFNVAERAFFDQLHLVPKHASWRIPTRLRLFGTLKILIGGFIMACLKTSTRQGDVNSNDFSERPLEQHNIYNDHGFGKTDDR